MNRRLFFLFGSIFFITTSILSAQTKINVFDEILFYDGYNTLEKLGDEIVPVPEGTIRHKTSLVATKLSESQTALFGDTITLEVILKAACDNYDRIGHVHLSLVPKGAGTYEVSDPNIYRLEIARFITPFMNKNNQPDTVPYIFDVSNLKHIFQDEVFKQEYDFWVELDIFGVPYAANKEVAGCAERNDVFYGSLNLITSNPSAEKSENNFFIHFFNNKSFNNYQENATDEIGKTVKSAEFVLNTDIADAKFYLITSNHGAYNGGEEYSRRWHYVYLNDKEILRYRPGRASCEPFRVYNTQANNIYSLSPRTDAQWQSFSNWCPGDVLDIRIISLGNLKAGKHAFKIEVPSALFIGQNGRGTDGNIPLSLYLQGKTDGESSIQLLSINNISEEESANVLLYPNPAKTSFAIKSDLPVKSIVICNISGQEIYRETTTTSVNVENLKAGIYIVYVTLADGTVVTQKLIKQ